MSTVSYGGVVLSIAKTNQFEMRPIYTEDGVDYLYTHCTLDVDAVLNPAATAYVAGDPPVASPGTLPPVTVAAIRHTLMQPRLFLSFTSPNPLGDPFVILESPQGGNSVDLLNGPKPIGCTVREVLGSRTFLVNWRVETWIHECPGGESDPTVLLSNRWSQESHINQQHLSTKVTNGIAHFRIDVLQNINQVADHFRSHLLPVVSPGYQRVQVNVVAVPAGNVIQWSTVDQEVMTDLDETDARQGGSGIVRLEGSYGVSSISTKEGIAGGTTMAQVDVRAWGNKYSSNWRMIQRCFEIVLAKITIGAGAIGFIRQAAIRESLMDRYVEVMIGFQQTPAGNVQVGALRLDGLRKDDIFQPANGRNPGLPNDEGSRGSAQEDLLVLALKSACELVPPYPDNAESGNAGAISTTSGPPPAVHVRASDELPEEPTPYSSSTQQYPYTSGRMDILYHKDEGLLAAPVAGDPGASDFKPVAVFRLHPPVGRKVVEWTSERVGALPAIPDPSTSGTNLTLLTSEITAATPEYVDDGASRVYRVSGRYEYVYANQTVGPGGSLDLGSIPWTTDAPGSLKIQLSDYEAGIVDP